MKNKKFIVIIIVVAIIAIGLGVLAFFLFNKKEENKPVSTDWGQKYYLYLNDDENKKDIKEDAEDAEDAKINFYEVKDVEEPVMVVSYKAPDGYHSNLYYIKDDKVNSIIYNEPSVIEFLYDINNKTYKYYYHFEKDKKDFYNELSKLMETVYSTDEKQKADFEFEKKTPVKVTNSKKEELKFTEFEKNFIVIETENKGVDFSSDYDSEKLKDVIEDGITGYTPQEKIITEDVQKIIEDRCNKIKEYDKLVKQKNEKEEINKVLSKLKGIWYDKKKGTCFELTKSGSKYYLNMGWFASESFLKGEITSVKKTANNKYTFTIKDTISKKNVEMDFNTTNIGKKKVSVNGTTFTYVASNWDDAYAKVL